MINIEELEKDQQQVIEKADVDTLASYCRELQTYEEEIAELEEQIKKKREKADKISSEIIPNMLAEQGISSLKLADGSSVGDIIKNEVSVQFGKGEDNKAEQLLDLAAREGYEPSQRSKVEPMTLKALYRERVEAGLDMPSQFFNIFIKDQTKIGRKS
jgi:phage terminase small subunit